MFASCGGGSLVAQEKQSFNKINLGGKDYYFNYPAAAQIRSVENEGDFYFSSISNCLGVDFGNLGVMTQKLLQREDLKDVQQNNQVYDDSKYFSWYLGSEMVLYGKTYVDPDFGFWAFDDAKDISACASYVDASFESLTDELNYINDKYRFSLKLPDDYRVQYLENGLVLKKDVGADPEYDIDDPMGSLAPYTIEIVFMPFENLTEYQNLNDYISFKYSGYSLEGADYDNVSGYYVDEGSGESAVRHFFTMNKDGTMIYEAYLKLPSFRYGRHAEEFEAVVKSLDIF